MKKAILSAIVGAVVMLPLSASAYNYAGHRWGGAEPWVGVDSTRLYLGSWRNAATDAMNSWNNAGAKFHLVNYVPSNNTMTLYYDPNTRTLAYARTYRQYTFWGNIYRGTITVNNAKNFNPPYTSGNWYDLRTVLRHEFGHWLKLDHVSNPNALMYDSLGVGQVVGITNDEWTAIRSIYGVR